MSRSQNATEQMTAAANDLDREHQAEQEARAYALALQPGELVRPANLQSVVRSLPFNAACRVLEDLESDGELARAASGHPLAWYRAQPPGKPSRGYALPLSSREHGALLRLLDWKLAGRPPLPSPPMNTGDTAILRAIRSRLKRPS